MKTTTARLAGALAVATACTASLIAPCTWAGESDGHHMSHAGMMEHDEHAHHHHMATDDVKRSMETYSLPQVKLTRDDGKSVSLTEELSDGRPVIMNFVFTSCTAVCPVTSRIFSMLQEGLGVPGKVHMVSVSIDPEQDTPQVLRKYASKYGAGPDWHFYTGTTDASIAMQQAFGVYRGDKMNHTPVTLLRAAPGRSWLRVEGFASADELLRDYRKLLAYQ